MIDENERDGWWLWTCRILSDHRSQNDGVSLPGFYQSGNRQFIVRKLPFIIIDAVIFIYFEWV